MRLLPQLPLPRSAHVDDRQLAEAVRGRRVLITGASSGIGAASAIRLGEAGARVMLVARRRDALDPLADRLTDAIALPCDLTDPEATRALCAQAQELGVDVLVSNAGHSIRRTLARTPDIAHDAERLMALNYLAPVRLIGALLPQLACVGGQVVCVSSIAAQSPTPGFAAYGASKAALDSFVRAAAGERAAAGVAFTTVNMPLVRTPMIESSPRLAAGVASLSADAAAELVAAAIVHRPRRIGTPAGEAAALGWALDPAITTAFDRRLRASGEPGVDGGRSRISRLSTLAFTTHLRR